MKYFKSSVLLATLIMVGCSTTSQLTTRPRYTVLTESVEDIRGNYSVDHFILHKRQTLSTVEVVTIDRFDFEGRLPMAHAIAVHYSAQNWRFMDTILVKTDSRLFELVDENPTRVTVGGGVREVVGTPFPPGLFEAMSTTETLSIQFYHQPFEIPPEGVMALRAFLLDRSERKPSEE